MDLATTVNALTLLVAVHGAPIIARDVCGARFDMPLDLGRRFLDGHPLLGPSKTWRGLVVALAVGAALAPLLGYEAALGLRFAAWAMFGDLLTSFSKRRLGITPGGRASGLDQLPEALLPLAMTREALAMNMLDVIGLACAFFLADLVLSRLLYRWHLRDRPY
jgi:CDP-2,3-bis-(O-geranylgeranyl)-sn-glycerol synthase